MRIHKKIIIMIKFSSINIIIYKVLWIILEFNKNLPVILITVSNNALKIQ